MKRTVLLMLILSLLLSCCAGAQEPAVSARSVILMEASTGQVLYEQAPLEKLPIASVTKIMTLLLICKSLESEDCTMEDTVTAGTNAAGMGGSQIYLKEGEEMPFRDLFKSVIIASANDAAVALAEYVMGSEGVFVAAMNDEAARLGMDCTHFANCTGLPAENHYSCARDVALMSRRLLQYDAVRQYTTTWLDSIRNEEFTLTNTNKMIRSYSGLTGLKTGFTQEAGFCVSATAKRDDMELIAVVIGSDTGKVRFETAANLLDYGFAGWTMTDVSEDIEPVTLPVLLGEQDTVTPRLCQSARLLVKKEQLGLLETHVTFPEEMTAPLEKGQRAGSLTVTLEGETLLTADYVVPDTIRKLSRGSVFALCLDILFP